RLPRADQALRGGGARNRGRARRAVRRAAEGRDHDRAWAGGRRARRCRSARRGRRARRRGRAAQAGRGACRPPDRRGEERALPQFFVVRVDNNPHGCYRGVLVYQSDNRGGSPMRRAVLLALALSLCAAPAARAWTWPAGGPVLRPFAFDPAHPYAGGQHRGIDVGGSIGEAVLAPAGGAVTFAGSVPNSGRVVTITTPDGYAVTLVHLGSIAVVPGAVVPEGAPIGTVGPSPDTPDPSVYLGIRIAAQPHGYVDPLTLLPPRPVAPLPAPVPTPAPEPPAAPVVPAAATPGPDAAPAPAAQPEASPSPTTSVTEPAAPSPGDSVAPAGDSASAPAES